MDFGLACVHSVHMAGGFNLAAEVKLMSKHHPPQSRGHFPNKGVRNNYRNRSATRKLATINIYFFINTYRTFGLRNKLQISFPNPTKQSEYFQHPFLSHIKPRFIWQFIYFRPFFSGARFKFPNTQTQKHDCSRV